MDSNNEDIRKFFEELDVQSRWVKGLSDLIEDYKEMYESSRNEVEERTKWAKSLSEELERVRGIVFKQKIDFEERTKWAKSLSEELERVKDSFVKKQNELNESAKFVESLQNELDATKEAFVNYGIELNERDEIIEFLEDDLKKTISEKNQFSQLIQSLKEEINRLKSIKSVRDLEFTKVARAFKLKSREVVRLRESWSYRIGRIFVVPVHLIFVGMNRIFVSVIVLLNFFMHPINFICRFKVRDIGRFFVALKDENSKTVVKNVCKYFSRKSMYKLKNAGNGLVAGKYKKYLDKEIKKKLIFDKHENPSVSIIIPVYNQWRYTHACLYSILENVKDVTYEIVIGDDLSTDETKNVNQYVENIVVNRGEMNLGFLRNCNNAAKKARGEYLVFLNNDTNVQEGWLESLLEVFDKDEKAGLVGSKLVYPNGKLQEAGGIVWNDAKGWNYGRLQDPSLPEFNYLKEVDYVSGASIMVKKELWEEIGGFDERYERAYFEDTDFAFEVRKHGYKVIYQPKSELLHFEGISCGTDEGHGEKQYQLKNREIFKQKWENELIRDQLPNCQDFFYARDRSKGKKVILVMDSAVPAYDQHAGARMVYQYVREFVQMGYNVKFLPSNFYKFEPYVTDLLQMGVEVYCGPWYLRNWEKYLEENGKYFDFVFLNRAEVAEKFIGGIKKYTNAKIIYNPVDLSFLREEREYEITGDEKFLDSSREHRKLEFDIFEKSESVVAVSEYELALLREEMPEKDIFMIPVYMYDKDIIDEMDGADFVERDGLLFVGGFNHRPNVDGLMWFVKDILPVVLEKHPNLVLKVAGSHPSDEVKALESDNVKVLGYVSDEELAQLYRKSRVVVAPLRFGAGIKGKVIEAMACGVPVVTTWIGAEGIVGDIEKSLLVADESEEFARKVCEVYSNEDLFKEMRRSAADLVKNFYCIDKAREVIGEFFIGSA